MSDRICGMCEKPFKGLFRDHTSETCAFSVKMDRDSLRQTLSKEREESKTLLDNMNMLYQTLKTTNGEQARELAFVRERYEAYIVLAESNAHSMRDISNERDALKAENLRLREALELLCFSVAGTEGTKTNAELPEWYRNRLKDAMQALEAGR